MEYVLLFLESLFDSAKNRSVLKLIPILSMMSTQYDSQISGELLQDAISFLRLIHFLVYPALLLFISRKKVQVSRSSLELLSYFF